MTATATATAASSGKKKHNRLSEKQFNQLFKNMKRSTAYKNLKDDCFIVRRSFILTNLITGRSYFAKYIRSAIISASKTVKGFLKIIKNDDSILPKKFSLKIATQRILVKQIEAKLKEYCKLCTNNQQKKEQHSKRKNFETKNRHKEGRKRPKFLGISIPGFSDEEEE